MYLETFGSICLMLCIVLAAIVPFIHLMRSQWREGRWSIMPYSGTCVVIGVLIVAFMGRSTIDQSHYMKYLDEHNYERVGEMPDGRIIMRQGDELCLGVKVDNKFKSDGCFAFPE